MQIKDFVEDKIYTGSEIKEAFGGSTQGGMRRSKETNSLILISKHGSIYGDKWISDENGGGDTLLYTGMGQVGDQSANYMQNKTLAESRSNGITVYLFESEVPTEYYYRGEVYLSGDPFFSEGLDSEGHLRKTIIFPLKTKNVNSQRTTKLKDIEKIEKSKEKQARTLSDAELKLLASRAPRQPVKKQTTSSHIDRDPAIAELTKRRANGICDLCDSPAPFSSKDGRPYLEEHHIVTLADGGPDSLDNTAALCPNCHRKMHIVKLGDDLKKLLRKAEEYTS